MNYKINISLLLLISILCAFKAEVKDTPRRVLLNRLDSLEMEIQQRRRSGLPIDKVEEQIAKLKWTIEESKSDSAVVTKEIVAKLAADTTMAATVKTAEPEKKKSFSETLAKYSTLDLMIIIVGFVAVLSFGLLVLFILYVRIFKKGGPKPQKVKAPKKSAKVATKAAPKKQSQAKPAGTPMTAAEKKETLEDIKSKLSALNNRKDKERFNEQIQKSKPVAAPNVQAPVDEGDFENPFLNQEVTESATPMENPFQQDASQMQQRQAAPQPVQKPVERVAPPVQEVKNIPPLPQQQPFAPVVEAPVVQPRPEPAPVKENRSVNDEIIAAFDSGEDLISIAKRMTMSIDQVKMIIRISGR